MLRRRRSLKRGFRFSCDGVSKVLFGATWAKVRLKWLPLWVVKFHTISTAMLYWSTSCDCIGLRVQRERKSSLWGLHDEKLGLTAGLNLRHHIWLAIVFKYNQWARSTLYCLWWYTLMFCVDTPHSYFVSPKISLVLWFNWISALSLSPHGTIVSHATMLTSIYPVT